MPLSEIILIIMALLTVAMLAAGVCRNIPIPYTVFLVFLGILLGVLARGSPEFAPLLMFQLTPDLVLFLFLPALIFESAFNLDARQLLKDLAPVLVLAVLALLISTAIIGMGLWLVLGTPILLALLFGALISATDPVAVIALFKELGMPARLTILVEGESLLNDATAIVAFKIILGLILGGAVSISAIGGAGLDFFIVFFGGILVGAAVGVILSELLSRMNVGISSYLIMSIVLAYSCFILAEHYLHVSGVMAVVAAGIALAVLGASRIPQSATHTIKATWEMIVLVCNSLLFLLVGLSIDVNQLAMHMDEILIAVVLMLAARAAGVYSLVPITVSLFKLPHVTLGERHVMWWGGLKGGLAIAIVLSIPDDLAGKERLLYLTLGVVMFTLLVNATTVQPLIRLLGIDKLTEDERSELKHGLVHAGAETTTLLERLGRIGLITRSTRQLIQKNCAEVFTSDAPVIDRRQDIRFLYMTALRMEEEELKHLYDIGLVQNYLYLELKTTLQRDRERHLGPQAGPAAAPLTVKPGLFLRMENAVLKRLREKDWATGLLSRYQFLRFDQSLQRDIAGILTTTHVLERLENLSGFDQGQFSEVTAAYRQRLERRHARLRRIATEFPDFYQRFETRLFSKIALQAAKYSAAIQFHEGEIGPKAYVQIERRIKAALAGLPPISTPAPKLQPSDLIGTVPLLNGLPAAILEQLAQRARTVTFLAGDIIIGEGEQGDALYIIAHGQVAILKGDQVIAELRDGDFFGEMALLHEQARTATARASTPSTLLRLRRKDVLALAASAPELKYRLEDAEEVRRTSSAR
jgi:CPA1 family monovalent cation:H+ antiporter